MYQLSCTVSVEYQADTESNPRVFFVIQESTGAVLLSTEPSKLIFYRGWPAGDERPDLALENENDDNDGHSSGTTNDVKGLEDDESTLADDDDFGVDAWNEDDWEEADDEEDGGGDADADADAEYMEEKSEQGGDDDPGGHWVSFSDEESEYTDTDVDELITAITQDGGTVEQNVTHSSDDRGQENFPGA